MDIKTFVIIINFMYVLYTLLIFLKVINFKIISVFNYPIIMIGFISIIYFGESVSVLESLFFILLVALYFTSGNFSINKTLKYKLYGFNLDDAEELTEFLEVYNLEHVQVLGKYLYFKNDKSVDKKSVNKFLNIYLKGKKDREYVAIVTCIIVSVGIYLFLSGYIK